MLPQLLFFCLLCLLTNFGQFPKKFTVTLVYNEFLRKLSIHLSIICVTIVILQLDSKTIVSLDGNQDFFS